MYNVTVYNTQLGRWINYEVSTTANTPKGVCFYTQDEDGFYVPKSTPKPSIYHRPIFRCKADEYKYQFTTRKVKTTVTDTDVYYNERRDKFASRSTQNTNTRTFITW